MERYEVIGEGRNGTYPYEVGIHWDTPPAQDPRPIGLSEGSGHMSMGGYFTLANILEEIWTDHLQICDCLWLRDLANEEKLCERTFSADEIFERWQARPIR